MLKKNKFLQNKGLFWKENVDMLRAVSMLTQLGLIMAVSIVIGVVLGLFIDKYFGLKGVFIGIGAIVGIVSGALTDWRLLLRFFDHNNNEKDNDE